MIPYKDCNCVDGHKPDSEGFLTIECTKCDYFIELSKELDTLRVNGLLTEE